MCVSVCKCKYVFVVNNRYGIVVFAFVCSHLDIFLVYMCVCLCFLSLYRGNGNSITYTPSIVAWHVCVYAWMYVCIGICGYVSYFFFHKNSVYQVSLTVLFFFLLDAFLFHYIVVTLTVSHICDLHRRLQHHNHQHNYCHHPIAPLSCLHGCWI